MAWHGIRHWVGWDISKQPGPSLHEASQKSEGSGSGSGLSTRPAAALRLAAMLLAAWQHGAGAQHGFGKAVVAWAKRQVPAQHTW